MASDLKPITLFGVAGGPNPWKVVMILEELSIPYTHTFVERADLHTPVFEKYNPNGRVPAIVDPNNGDFVLWESGAIVEYLVDRYDGEGKLSFVGGGKDSQEEKWRWECKQWLHFQMSGQGPYYGQAMWFKFSHPEQVPSALERYKNEGKRVIQVRDDYLRQNKKQYLVGDKLTYADISFVIWDLGLTHIVYKEGEVDWKKDYPDWFAWHKRLLALPAVKKALDDRNVALIAAGNPAFAVKTNYKE